MSRTSAMRAAAARSAPTTPAPGATAIRTDPIRTTVDLDPALWTDVQEWLAITQSALRRKVKMAQVLRVMLILLSEDGKFAETVRQHL